MKPKLDICRSCPNCYPKSQDTQALSARLGYSYAFPYCFIVWIELHQDVANRGLENINNPDFQIPKACPFVLEHTIA